MNQQELEKGKIYPAIVIDYFGSYKTKSKFLGKGNGCKRNCNLFVYPVAGTNESIKANIKEPDAMGISGIEEMLFDDKGRIMIDKYENTSCCETSPNSERGYKGTYMPQRYIELLSKFYTPERYVQLLNTFRGDN